MFVIGLYLGFGVTFMASSVSIFSTDFSLIDVCQSYIFRVHLYTRVLIQLFRSDRPGLNISFALPRCFRWLTFQTFLGYLNSHTMS